MSPWKICSNSCSAPAGASTGPNTGARFSFFCVAGLFAAVILFTAAGLAAPLFIIMVVLVVLSWLMWGFAIHTERLHDRDKSAWWLLVFYVVPAVFGQLAKTEWFAGAAGTILHYALALAGLALSIWGFVEIGCLRGTAESNRYGPNPSKR